MVQTGIPREQWTRYCAGFNRAHRGWLVTLASIPTAQLEEAPERLDSGGQVIVREVRLEGLDLDTRTGSCGIAMQTQTQGALVEHRRTGVMRLFRLSLDGVDQGLRIDSVDRGKGETTLIWFRAPAAGDAVDGITEFEMQGDSP